jgi:hypothetical protein
MFNICMCFRMCTRYLKLLLHVRFVPTIPAQDDQQSLANRYKPGTTKTSGTLVGSVIASSLNAFNCLLATVVLDDML